jgi:hypothetical protein
MIINIQTIPHSLQRYPTVGDWFYDKDGNLQIRVSAMGNPRYEFLIAIHELVEEQLCRERGISQNIVDAFDKEFEANRDENSLAEPGESSDAPYATEHCFATGIERLMCAELCVSWAQYEKTVNSL